jgi:hypothetical protein
MWQIFRLLYSPDVIERIASNLFQMMFGYFITGFPRSFFTFLSLRYSLQHFTSFDIIAEIEKPNFNQLNQQVKQCV